MIIVMMQYKKYFYSTIRRPLSEPAKLKERFDAIFQLTGFVKFVEKGKSRLKELVSLEFVVWTSLHNIGIINHSVWTH